MMSTQGNLLADPGEGANEIVQDCSVKDRKNGSYVSMGLGKTLRHAWLFLVEVVKELEYKSLRLDGDTVPPTLKLKGNEWVSLLAVERT